MMEYRCQARARRDGMTESRVAGGPPHLVTGRPRDEDAGELCDEHGRPVAPAPAVVSHLRPERGARAGVLPGRAGRAGRAAIGDAAMSERSKLTASHPRRAALVYVRQSSQAQLERNVE